VISTRSRSEPLPAVPLSSIISDIDGDYVLLVNEDDRVTRRNITITDKTEALALVGSGLIVGERVIVQGLTKAKIGSQVSAEFVGEEGF
jgi:multidrug efflux pump subunit AcrA (membrane-fusion protein)